MKHFSIAEWTDYVHGLADGATADRMRAHLHTGCTPCGATVRTLEKLVAVIAADISPEVPQYVVHNAKSIFALQQPEKVTLSSMVASLVFDSFRQPLAAGVRNQQRFSRHAVYQAGDLAVDLRLDRENKGSRISLVGQVGHRTSPAAVVANVPVSLMAGQRVIAQTMSNEYGEFQFEYEPAAHLQLHVPVGAAGKSIEVRLHELTMADSSRDDVLPDEDPTNQSGRS